MSSRSHHAGVTSPLAVGRVRFKFGMRSKSETSGHGRCEAPCGLFLEQDIEGCDMEPCMRGRRRPRQKQRQHHSVAPMQPAAVVVTLLVGAACGTAAVSRSNPLGARGFMSLAEDQGVDCKLLAPQYCTVRVYMCSVTGSSTRCAALLWRTSVLPCMWAFVASCRAGPRRMAETDVDDESRWI